MTSDNKKPAPADRCLSRLVRLRRWRRARPHCGGWWHWRENGSHRPEKLLLSATGQTVADDDEWEQATGFPPSDGRGESENYWEGTDTTQKMMPGHWRQCLPNDQDQTRTAAKNPKE